MTVTRTIETAVDWLETLSRSSDADFEFIRCVFWLEDSSFRINDLALRHHLIIMVEKGAFELELDGESKRLEAGSLLWVSPGTVRKMWSESGTVVVNYRLHFNLTINGSQVRMKDPYYILKDCRELIPTFQRLNRLHRMGGKYSNFSAKGMIVDLSAQLFQLMDQVDEGQSGIRKLTTQQCMRIDDYIMKYLNTAVQPADLAAIVDLTPDYFTRLFKATYGVAPRFYLKRERLRYAASSLLETDYHVGEVAREVGYENIHLFSRQFRQIYNCTPTQYRRQQEC